MKTLTTYKLLTLVLAITLLFSCHDDEFVDIPQAKTPETSDVQAIENDILPQIKLGKKLENPYSVTNMKRALKNLNNKQLKKTTSTSKGNVGTLTTSNYDIDIEPTHLYVKFIPKSEEELSILESDSTLILYSYPLDYEIIEGSGDYRDPEVPEGQPTYQYCAVKVGKQLPTEVENEIIEELFIPDEEDTEDSTSDTAGKIKPLGLSTNDGSIEALVDEALRITNNLDKIEGGSDNESGVQTLFFKRRSKWRPAGTIKVWDDDVVATTTRRVFSHWQYYPCEDDEWIEFREPVEQCEEPFTNTKRLKLMGVMSLLRV